MVTNLKLRWLGLTVALDLLLTVAALLMARLVRGFIPAGIYLDERFAFAILDEPLFFPAAILIPLVILVWLVVFAALSVYHDRFVLTQYSQIQPIFVAVTGATLVFAGLAYFFLPDLSRFLFLYFYLFDLLFLISWRKLIYRLLERSTLTLWRPRHRVLVVGGGEAARSVAEAISTYAWAGLELVGFVHDGPEALGPVDELARLVRDHYVDEVIFALPPGHQPLLQQVVFQLLPLSVNLRLVPDVIDLVFIRASIEDFAGLPLIGLQEPAIGLFNRLIKRSFDITVAALLLLLSAPLFLLVVLLIKLDTRHAGSVFYAGQRIGENGRLFTMFKFRTMVAGADQAEADLFLQTGSGLGVNKRPDDPRVTPLGRFLRRTSLDELPQLLNVLRGNMSLVGPRPELPWLVGHYELWQYQRFTVPQGMTGWWQVKNRSRQVSYQVRVEDDLYYIHNYSFFLDLRILWLTMGAIIRGDGAY